VTAPRPRRPPKGKRSARYRVNLQRERIVARALLDELLTRIERDGWAFDRVLSLRVDQLVAASEGDRV
jgi:hypothetical protein